MSLYCIIAVCNAVLCKYILPFVCSDKHLNSPHNIPSIFKHKHYENTGVDTCLALKQFLVFTGTLFKQSIVEDTYFDIGFSS